MEMANVEKHPITPRILGKDISEANILGGVIAMPLPIPIIALPIILKYLVINLLN